MAKKTKKTSKKNIKKKSKLNENFWALIMISTALILTIIVSMPNIGFIGGFVKFVILALFSKFFYFISITVIVLGVYKLIFYNTYSFKNLNKIDMTIFMLMLMLIYTAFNLSQLQENSSISFESLKNIVSDAQVYKGLGIICYISSFFFYKLIGKTGIMLFVFFSLLYLVIKYQRKKLISIVDLTKHNIYNKTQEVKSKREKRQEYKKEKNKINDIVANYFNDAPGYDDISEKTKKTLLRYDDNISNDVKITGINDVQDENIKDDCIEDYEEKNEVIKTEELNISKNDVSYENNVIGEKISNLDNIKFDKNETEKIETIIENDNQKDEDDINLSQGLKLESPKKKIYKKPLIELLNEYKKVVIQDKTEKLRNAQALTQTLASFGVEAKVENIAVGPTITRYELKPKVGTKVSKITNLTEDLALALAAKAIRIEAPIPGKSFIGVEVPNEISQTVSFKEVIKTCIDKKDSYNIVFAMGKDISGEVILSDITKMPHALIAGSTGSGKSVCINTIICSIIYNYSPEEVKLILVDPKVVELSIYNKLPHLIIPVVTDMKKTPQALAWAVNEMEKRYALFAEHKSKDINSYNQKSTEKMPRIVIIIDELADLMMVAPKEIEEAICRLAQKARACGIHLIVATQRPSVDVITGLIKANIPSRIAFAVSSQTDSRTILDSGGAEKLLGKGDMLYSPIGMNKPIRIQGAFLTEEEVEKITEFIEINNPVEGLQEKQEEVSKQIDDIVLESDKKGESDDDLYDKVVEFAISNGEISVSLVQRQFRIGYNRASRIVDDMEKNGIVGKSDGSKPRKVLNNIS
ncbi:MAG: DNA translocase FtsK [Peptoanaerobacter stomatis]|uniref:DNA translocase FtsK n=1 Tax=Peptoanaerobacter stomatis TaxID=796937 RepID=UPI003FA0CCF2